VSNVVDRQHLLAIAATADAPANVVQALAADGDAEVRDAGQLHIVVAGELGEGWEEEAGRALARAPLGQTDERVSELLPFAPVPAAFVDDFIDPRVIRAGVDNTVIPLREQHALLERLATECGPSDAAWVAGHPNTPTDLVQRLTRYRDPEVASVARFRLVFDGESPAEGQSSLRSWGPDPRPPQVIARDPETEPEILTVLARHKEQAVRREVALNPASPPEALDELARGADNAIFAATHPRLAPATAERLAQTAAPNVLFHLAANDALSEAVLEKVHGAARALANQGQRREVAAQLLTNPATPAPLRQMLLAELSPLASSDVRMQVVLGLGAGAPDERARLIGQLLAGKGREALASHRRTPPETLQVLARDTTPEVRRLVAGNGSTLASTLDTLASDPSQPVRAAVARNPSAPPHILARLLGDDDRLVSESVKQNVAWLRSAEHAGREAAQVSATAPARFVNQVREPDRLARLAQHEDPAIRCAVAAHRLTPLESLLALASDASEAVRDALVARHDLPLQLFERLATDASPRLRERLASSPKTPPDVMIRLAHDEDPRVRARVGQNPRAPGAAIASLARDLTPELLLRHFSTPTEILEGALAPLMANDPLKFDRLATGLKSHPNAPTAALDWLARRPDASLRMIAAGHPRTSPAAREACARDTAALVRVHAAGNPAADPSILEGLAADPDPMVRRAVAMNHRTPASALAGLAGTASLKAVVALNPNTPADVLDQLADDEGLFGALSRNPTVGSKTLERWARSYAPWQRVVVAKNPATPVAVLAELVTDPACEVRMALLAQSALSDETRAQIERDLLEDRTDATKSFRVSKALASSESVEVRRLLAQDPTREVRAALEAARSPSERVEAYLQSSEPFVRLMGLLHPLAPSSVLADAARSLRWWERYAAAVHANTTEEDRRRLEGDGNRIVRAAARAV
jgi:pentose-5-phosphate-3-epimerase